VAMTDLLLQPGSNEYEVIADGQIVGRISLFSSSPDAARRRFDVVMAWSVDRLGRSLQDLIAFMQELRSLKIDLYSCISRASTPRPLPAR
jgi:DNA invertase Pin-like site-specific DNA recombinase